MAADFRSTVAELWAVLKLAPPKFAAEPEITLTISGMDLKLTNTPDERHLLLTGVAGQLAPELRTSSEQVRVLLQKSLAQLLVSSACLSILVG